MVQPIANGRDQRGISKTCPWRVCGSLGSASASPADARLNRTSHPTGFVPRIIASMSALSWAVRQITMSARALADPRPATCNSSSIWSKSKPHSLCSVTTWACRTRSSGVSTSHFWRTWEKTCPLSFVLTDSVGRFSPLPTAGPFRLRFRRGAAARLLFARFAITGPFRWVQSQKLRFYPLAERFNRQRKRPKNASRKAVGGAGTVDFRRRAGEPDHTVRQPLLGRPDHRQDAVADCFRQLRPCIGNRRQIGVIRGHFRLNGAASGALAARNVALSRRFCRLGSSSWDRCR